MSKRDPRGRRPPKTEARSMGATGYKPPSAIAKILGVAASSVYRWASAGAFPDQPDPEHPGQVLPAVRRGVSGNMWILVSAAKAFRRAPGADGSSAA